MYRRICAVQSPHVDLFLCETMASIAEARAAATAGCETGKPVWLAMTLDDADLVRLRSGELLTDAVAQLRDLPVQALLLNCSRPETISQAWASFADSASLPIGAYANGFTSIDALTPGTTVSELEARQDLDPEAYAAFVLDWIGQGATIVGGCCETLPAHIAFLRSKIDQLSH